MSAPRGFIIVHPVHTGRADYKVEGLSMRVNQNFIEHYKDNSMVISECRYNVKETADEIDRLIAEAQEPILRLRRPGPTTVDREEAEISGSAAEHEAAQEGGDK
jgi:hypothetical protein